MRDVEKFRSDPLDDRVLVEVEKRDLATVEAHLEAIEPESIILAVREPGSCCGLSPPLNAAFDGRRPRSLGCGHLLRHTHACSDLELRKFEHLASIRAWQRRLSHGSADPVTAAAMDQPRPATPRRGVMVS